jgi:cytochrome c oxidase cbb3-type subunit 3
MSRDRHEPARDELLDHEADGIREFDNALPRWWLYGFYLTIAWAVVYAVNYHVLPSPLWGKATLVAEYEAELAAAPKPTKPAVTRAGGPAPAALVDEASLSQGRAIFEADANVCSSCHRADLGGLVGPNLTDEHWLHGCSVEEIVTSIRTGYPLQGMMPYGTGTPLSDDQLVKVTSYILSKRGSSPPGPKAIDAERDRVCR